MVLGSTPPSAWRITWACCSAILLSVPDEKFHSPDQDVPGLPTLCAVATIGRVTEKSATRNMNRDVVRITAPAARLRRQLSHIRHPHLPSRRRHRTTLRLQRQRQHRRQPRFLAECLALGVDWEGEADLLDRPARPERSLLLGRSDRTDPWYRISDMAGRKCKHTQLVNRCSAGFPQVQRSHSPLRSVIRLAQTQFWKI